WEVKDEGDRHREKLDGLRALWAKYTVLGLTAKEEVPARPDGAALACRMTLEDTAVEVTLAASHPSGTQWDALGSLRVELPEETPISEDPTGETPALEREQQVEQDAARLGDAVAGALAQRLVRIKLSKGPRVKNRESYRIKIVNESPLILNGLA